MKLVDLQRIAPNGGRYFLSYAFASPGDLRWQEIEETTVAAHETAEMVVRIEHLRNLGSHLHWRLTVHPYGPASKFPTTTREWPPIAPPPSLASDSRAYDPSLRIVRHACLTIHETHHDVTFGPRAIEAVEGVVSAVAAKSEQVPAKPVEVNVHELADAMLSMLLRAKAHGDSQHAGQSEGEAVSLCTTTGVELKYLAALYIQACDYNGIG